MKKVMFLSVFILFSVSISFGQLNPIKNFSYRQWHDMFSNCIGYNCFEIRWDQPDISANDTLVGYNIYRNDLLWRFQEYPGVYCNDIRCDNSNGGFILGEAFWIKVKAVYNYNKIEAIAKDSALCSGIMTKINENTFEEQFRVNNPILKGNEISIKTPENFNENFNIKIINFLGQTINDYKINKENNTIKISTNHFESGIYQVLFLFRHKIISKRIIII